MQDYDPLQRFLERHDGKEVQLPFAEIESIIGKSLPKSARRYRRWWANENIETTSHVQCKSWQLAGWRVDTVDIERGTIRFVR